MLQGRHLVGPTTAAAAATALAGQTGELPAAASWLPPTYPRQRGHVMADPASPPIFTWTCIEGAPHYYDAIYYTRRQRLQRSSTAARVKRLRTAWTRGRTQCPLGMLLQLPRPLCPMVANGRPARPTSSAASPTDDGEALPSCLDRPGRVRPHQLHAQLRETDRHHAPHHRQLVRHPRAANG